jgi:hypothetical protein
VFISPGIMAQNMIVNMMKDMFKFTNKLHSVLQSYITLYTEAQYLSWDELYWIIFENVSLYKLSHPSEYLMVVVCGFALQVCQITRKTYFLCIYWSQYVTFYEIFVEIVHVLETDYLLFIKLCYVTVLDQIIMPNI